MKKNKNMNIIHIFFIKVKCKIEMYINNKYLIYSIIIEVDLWEYLIVNQSKKKLMKKMDF